MVDLQNLYSLFNVVKYGNLSEAARFENISQPAMSKRMQSVSEAFNTPIFSFKNNYQSLTEEGQIIYRGASGIRYIYSKMENDLLRMTQSITIGISHECSTKVLLKTLTNYCNFNSSRIKIYTLTGSHFEIINMVKEHIVDIAIIMDEDYRNFKDTSLYEVGRVITGQIGVVFPRGIPIVHKARATPKDLSHYPAIVPRNLPVIATINQWFGDSGIPNVVCETSNHFETLEAVDSEMGYSFVPLYSNWIDSKRFAVIPLTPKLEVKSRIITSSNNKLTKTIHGFIHSLSNQRQVF